MTRLNDEMRAGVVFFAALILVLTVVCVVAAVWGP